MTEPANGGAQEATTGSGQQGQESAAAQGQTEDTGAQQTGQEPGQQGGGTLSLDPSTIEDPEVRAYVERVQADAQAARREAANYRTRAQEAQSKVTEYERANETEQQRVERERQELQAERDRMAQELRDLRVGGAVKAAATAAQAFDPDLIYTLAQNAGLEIGEDGNPKNLDDVLAGLKRDKPYLFRRTDAGAGEGNGQESTPNGGGMNDWIRGRATGAAR